jgi:poly-gamma-glutamate capsule biosynthesis protein CapA/YwtB (metallophosphatase superfamily)
LLSPRADCGPPAGRSAPAARPIAAAIAILAIFAALPRILPQDQQKPAELWLGGDVSLGDGGSGQLRGISGIVQGAAGIVNLEGPVAARSRLAGGGLRLWNSPAALDELSGLNVKVAGIANNHAGDAGRNGPRHSVDALLEHGILPAGRPAGVALLEVNGSVIAVTAHDLTRGVPPDLAQELELAKRQAVVAGVVRPVDVLIATFHVTGPPSYLPRPELREAVEIALRAGAEVIVAHGTHALGPVERRGNKVIAWGLGNLAFACDCTAEREAILLRISLHRGQLVKAEVLPIQAGVNGSAALPSADPGAIFDLLEAIGSDKLNRHGPTASF